MDVQVILKEEDYKELLKYKEYYEKNLIRFVYGNYKEIYQYTTQHNLEAFNKIKEEGFHGEGSFETKKEGFYSVNDFCINANETLKTVQREKIEKIIKANEILTQINDNYTGLKKWILSRNNVLKQYKKDFGCEPSVPFFEGWRPMR